MDSSANAAVSAHGPYEDLAIRIIELVEKIIDGQPPEVKKQIWEWYIEDTKAWRDFWKSLKPSST